MKDADFVDAKLLEISQRDTSTAHDSNSFGSPETEADGTHDPFFTPMRRALSGLTEFESPLRQQAPDYQLDDFEVIKSLGNGSHGRVDLVRCKYEPSQLFAVKIIDKSKVAKAKAVNFQTEARILRSLDGFGFATKLHAVLETETKAILVMEYVTGGDLFSQQENQPTGTLTEDCGAFYAATTLLLLESIHAQGILHRDVKSENVLIAADGYPKLADFGLAKDGMIGRRTHTFCGTNEFIAPEVIRQSSEGYDFASDWWGFGCLLFDMICGQSPFYSHNM